MAHSRSPSTADGAKRPELKQDCMALTREGETNFFFFPVSCPFSVRNVLWDNLVKIINFSLYTIPD